MRRAISDQTFGTEGRHLERRRAAVEWTSSNPDLLETELQYFYFILFHPQARTVTLQDTSRLDDMAKLEDTANGEAYCMYIDRLTANGEHLQDPAGISA